MDDKLAAKILIQKCQGTFYGIYVDKLVAEMAQKISYNPGVCYQVFVQLAEMDYSTSDIINVARGLLDKTNSAVLSQLATTPDGGILIITIYAILKCGNADNQTAARCTKIQQSFAIATSSTQLQPIVSNNTSEPRKLSDTEMDWYANYNESPIASKSGPNNTFDTKICWQLPRQGTGYVVYSPDDLDNAGRKRLGQALLNDNYGYDQIGTKETIETMIIIAKEWNLYTDTKLQYGDISRPGGVNTPDHGTHMDGRAFDVRPLRNDSQTGDNARLDYTDSTYHRDFTKEFIRIIKKNYPAVKILFNDSKIYDLKEFSGFVSPSSKDHNNHLHVIFLGGK